MMFAASSTPGVSIIIPFRNAGTHLPALLDSLIAQHGDVAFEVVAVDNGSTDHSRSVLAEYATRISVRIIDAFARPNPSYARNVGVRAASGSKLIFIDADDVVSPNYVSALAVALDQHALVTSRVDSTSLNPAWVRDAHGTAWQSEGVGVFFDLWPATGVNIGIGRTLYDGLGGFPEEFAASEDIAFSWIAHKRGVSIHFVGDAIYSYRYRHDLVGLFQQSTNWGRYTVLLYKRFGPDGMPGRMLRASLAEWLTVGAGLLRPGIGSARPSFVVRAGSCWGRLLGSLRYGVKYL
jgi:glycosyltransferase involved in cell wall biosynthesis